MKKKEKEGWDEIMKEVKENYSFEKVHKVVMGLMETCVTTVLKESKDDIEMGGMLSMLTSRILSAALVTTRKSLGRAES